MTAVRLRRANIWNGWSRTASEQGGTEQLLDLAAKSQQNRVSADLPDYIMDREIVRAAFRTAKEADATDQEWQDFIDRITRAHRSSEEGSEIDA